MDIFALLWEHFPGMPLERNFSFAKHTTIGCGGTAGVCACPNSEKEAAELISFLDRKNISHCFIGAGANVLPADGYFEGVVVRFSRLNFVRADGETLLVGAGATGGALLRFATANHLGGFEFLTGIPMTVGGAVVMNAGVQGRHLSDVVESVTAVEEGKLRNYSKEECRFSEKSSVFQRGIAVLLVKLRGRYAEPKEIALFREFYRNRRKHLPKGRSMGCVFVNPNGSSAGALIDGCGLKGYSLGGARVSERHANFIINEGATSSEISELIETVKDRVFQQTGILLREEIRRIP